MLSTRFRGYSGLAGTLMLILLLAACSPGSEEDTSGTPQTARPPETTATSGTTRMEEEKKAGGIVVEQIDQGQRGLARRQVMIAGSAQELAEATGLKIPNSGRGLYVSAHAGERPTGGYRVSLSGTGDGGVRVRLRGPGEGAIVTQALTQPYAVAVVKTEEGGVPEAGDLRFVNASGGTLGWPVARAGATGG